MKRTFLLLALAWMACSTAVAQTPTFGGGSGSEADPYLITSKADWDALARAEGQVYANAYGSCREAAPSNYITITFYGNDGTATPPVRSQTKPIGNEVALDWNIFDGPEGARFIGWAVGSPNRPVEYQDHETITVDEDINLYAKWVFPVVSLTNESPKSVTLVISNDNETRKLEVTVTPANPTNDTILWSSDDTNVATVDARGVVTPKSPGKATITALAADKTNGEKTATFEVRVVQRWKLSNSVSVYADLDEYNTLTITGSGEMPGTENSRWAAVKEVVITDGITSLGDNAFNGLTACTSVSIASTVTRIGVGAFKGCSSLYELTIPSSVLTIGREAFKGCNILTSVYNYAQTPQTIANNDVFDLTTIHKATLYVGVGRKTAYDGALVWQEFKTITEGYCLVKFEPNNGGFIPSQMPLVNTRITPPPNPELSGASFEGWYVDQNYTTKWFFEREVTGNITLYAKWTEYVTVSFDARGGTLVEDVTATKGDKIDKPSVNPTRTNFDFIGWYTDPGCVQPWSFTDDRVTADRTLYAKWQPTAQAPVQPPVQPSVIPQSRHSSVLQVYPNPTSGELNVVNAKGAEIRVYNTAGVLLQRTRDSHVNMTDSPNGLYILRIGEQSVKVVKK
ncbi:bacterial Ig-like domain [Candidatus Symbiothrix dinenymphae]|nr:bacterial Ig-like domain [Candidatus Symbiothrix dinenymphae]